MPDKTTRPSQSTLNAQGKHDQVNRWFTWEPINGDGLCPTYMWRLTLLRLPNGRRLYLHHFVGDDWCKDPHDHPKVFWSIGLKGGYDEDVYEATGYEVSSDPNEYSGPVLEPRTIEWRAPWFRRFDATHIHRIRAAHTGGAWTLCYTGPVTRQWGFWHLLQRWVPFRIYLNSHAQDRKDC